MTTILQVEYRLTLLSIREEILQSLGHPVGSAPWFTVLHEISISRMKQ